MMPATHQRAQNLRTGLALTATFVAMLIGSILYILLYH